MFLKAFEEIRDAEHRASAITEAAEREEKEIASSANEKGEELLRAILAELASKREELSAENADILAGARKKADASYADEEKRILTLAEKNMDKAVELVFKRMVAQWQ